MFFCYRQCKKRGSLCDIVLDSISCTVTESWCVMAVLTLYMAITPVVRPDRGQTLMLVPSNATDPMAPDPTSNQNSLWPWKSTVKVEGEVSLEDGTRTVRSSPSSVDLSIRGWGPASLQNRCLSLTTKEKLIETNGAQQIHCLRLSINGV